MEGVIEVFVVEAFKSRDFARMLHYRLLDAAGSSVQFSDSERARFLQRIKQDVPVSKCRINDLTVVL